MCELVASIRTDSPVSCRHETNPVRALGFHPITVPGPTTTSRPFASVKCTACVSDTVGSCTWPGWLFSLRCWGRRGAPASAARQTGLVDHPTSRATPKAPPTTTHEAAAWHSTLLHSWLTLID